jgi:gamma-glutamyltranspeptidase/glutathione hydrolase
VDRRRIGGVPGNIRLMAEAHRRWGRLPWADLFAPAIALADDGFTVTPRLNGALTRIARFWDDFPEARAIYWVDGKPAAVGATIRNPALAGLLRTIASDGPDAFYSGGNARAISEAVARSPRNPSVLNAADLAGYRAKERPPVCGSYRGYRVCGMGPPSSGAVAVLQILGMLERFDMKALGKDSPVAWHLIAEAMRLAYADRETWLGDRDFVGVPVAGLIDPAYLAARSRLISPTRRIGTYAPGTPPGAEPRTQAPSGEVPGTTHFVAIDGAGNIATMTSTVEASFGSQIIANGMILNNELTDFSFVPEQGGRPVANRVEAGKRPLSSMSPTIVYDAKGRPVFTIGAAGGKTIIMQVTKTLIAHLDWGLDAEAAIALPLLYFRGDPLVLEESPHFTSIRPALEKLGHTVTTAEMPLKANGAQCVPGGGWRGAADPRSEGVALTE